MTGAGFLEYKRKLSEVGIQSSKVLLLKLRPIMINKMPSKIAGLDIETNL
jgi:hypothetical protein